MEGPLSAFEDWLTSQPHDVRVDVVVMALAPIPGLGLPSDALLSGDDVVLEFLDKLEAHVQNSRAHAQVAAVLAIRSAVEFFVLRTRGTEEAWDQTRRNNERLISEMATLGEEARTLKDVLRDMPLRQATWLRAAHQWRELVSSAWSDTTLERWLASQAHDTLASEDE